MRKRILLIDDEDDIREVAALSLESVAEWEVESAPNGEEGLKKAETNRPDAILLDVMMPGMDGPATFRRLRASAVTREIPVIMLTAKVQGSDHRQFREMGADGVIAKPFDPMRLAALVSETLGWND